MYYQLQHTTTRARVDPDSLQIGIAASAVLPVVMWKGVTNIATCVVG